MALVDRRKEGVVVAVAGGSVCESSEIENSIHFPYPPPHPLKAAGRTHSPTMSVRPRQGVVVVGWETAPQIDIPRRFGLSTLGFMLCRLPLAYCDAMIIIMKVFELGNGWSSGDVHVMEGVVVRLLLPLVVANCKVEYAYINTYAASAGGRAKS